MGVWFGTVELPNVKTISYANASVYVERDIPGSNWAYRKQRGRRGWELTITGEITSSDYAFMKTLAALADGIARRFACDDSDVPSFEALLLDPAFTHERDDPGKIRYQVRIVEQNNPS